MTVKELISDLKKFDENATILLKSDEYVSDITTLEAKDKVITEEDEIEKGSFVLIGE